MTKAVNPPRFPQIEWHSYKWQGGEEKRQSRASVLLKKEIKLPLHRQLSWSNKPLLQKCKFKSQCLPASWLHLQQLGYSSDPLPYICHLVSWFTSLFQRKLSTFLPFFFQANRSKWLVEGSDTCQNQRKVSSRMTKSKDCWEGKGLGTAASLSWQLQTVKLRQGVSWKHCLSARICL